MWNSEETLAFVNDLADRLGSGFGEIDRRSSSAMPYSLIGHLGDHAEVKVRRETKHAEAAPLAGIIFYGPLISAALWLGIGFVAWTLLV